jgi:hypothetical protein
MSWADATSCRNNPWAPGSSNYADYINRYQCWLYDSSIQNPSPEPSSSAGGEQTSMSYSSSAHESAPAATSAPKASKTVVKGLQTAINKFFGVTLGAPIVVDGVIGGGTLSAVKGILEWMPQAGYDTSTITQLIGTSPTAASISLQAAALSNVIDWVADDNGFTLGTVPSPPSVPAIQTSAGKAPAGPLPKGPSQRAAGGILGLGLPDPVVYAGGAAFALGLLWLVFKHKR